MNIMDELLLVLIRKKVKNPKFDKLLTYLIFGTFLFILYLLYLVIPNGKDASGFTYYSWKDMKINFFIGICSLIVLSILMIFNRRKIYGTLVLNKTLIKSDWFIKKSELNIEKIRTIEYSYFANGGLETTQQDCHWIKIVSNGNETLLNEVFLMQEKHSQFLDYLELYRKQGIMILIDSAEDYFPNGIEIKRRDVNFE